MKTFVLVWVFVAFSILGYAFYKEAETFISHQDFESNFEIKHHPDEFLPGWSANEVTASNSRVFRAPNEGVDQSTALGIQVIGTFNAEIYVKTSTLGLENLKITFSAKTKRNGTGNRPVYLFVSFASSPNGSFQHKVQIGNDQTFLNADADYQTYGLLIPPQYENREELFIKLDVIYGEGSGSAARLFLDDFMIKINQEIRVEKAHLINPYEILLEVDRRIQSLEPSQIRSEDFVIMEVAQIGDFTFTLSSDQLIPTKELLFTIGDLKDLSNHPLMDLEVSIDHKATALGQVFIRNQDELELSFTHFLDPSYVLPVDHYRINGESPTLVEMSDNNYQLRLQPTRGLQLEQPVEIEVLTVKNEQGEISLDLTKNLTYLDGIESVYLPTTNQIRLVHHTTLSADVLPDQGFAILDENLEISAVISATDSSILELDLSRPLAENLSYDLLIPLRRTTQGELLSGSRRVVIADFTPPEIQKVSFLSAHEILLSFSEDLDPFLKLIPSFYQINGVQPDEVRSGESQQQVILSLPFHMTHQDRYTLTVEGVEDLNRNKIEPVTIDFTFTDPGHIPFKAIVINEVMPAPRAENPLPNSEYIELFNPGPDTINLGGIRLANSRTETTLPGFPLAPDAFVLLTPANQADNFAAFGEVIGLAPWPVLLNAGDEVKIMEASGAVIDSLSYNHETFGGASNAGIGMSLEIVNPFVPCNVFGNLKPSTAPKLGTPGAKNAVFDSTPDKTKPRLLTAMVVGTKMLNLRFSKALGPDAMSFNFEIQPFIGIQEVHWEASKPAELTILLDNILQEKTPYQVRALNLRDCSGNALDPEWQVAKFMVPSKADKGDVVLNEVLFNPRTGAPKFVEIYNRSAKSINLKNWKLANFANEMISNRRLVFTKDHIIGPYDYLVFTTDAKQLKSEYPKGASEKFVELSSLPSYPIREGTVIWMDPEEEIMEKFDYHEKMHHPIIRDPKGVSLERISHEGEVNNPNHWQSASSSVGYASPGMRNSQKIPLEQVSGDMITIVPKVFVPDAPGEQNFTAIQYDVPQAGLVATVRIYSIAGQLIKDIAQNEIWGNRGIYTWNGTDLSHRRVRPGYYIVWVEWMDINLGETGILKKTVVVGVK